MLRYLMWLTLPLTIYYFYSLDSYVPHLNSFLIDSDGRPLGRDFVNWWTAGCLILDHSVMTLFDFDAFNAAQTKLFHHAFEFKNWSYPPQTLPWTLWLGILPYPVALAAWTLLGLAALCCAVLYKRPGPVMTSFALLMAPGCVINAVEGQTGFFTAACIVGGFRLLDEMPLAAGAIFSLLTFKPQFVLLVVLAVLAGGHKAALVSMTFFTALLVAMSIFLFGWGPWSAYLDTTLPVQRAILEMDLGQLFQNMMVSPFMASRILGADLTGAYAVTALLSVFSLLSVIYVVRATRNRALRIGVTSFAVFLMSPYMLTYDTPTLNAAILFLIAGTGLTVRGEEGSGAGIFDVERRQGQLLLSNAARVSFTGLFLVMWFLPLAVMKLNALSLPVYPLVTFLILCSLLIVVARAGTSERTPKHRPEDLF